MNIDPEYLRDDDELTEELLDAVEDIGGPRFRSLEERADGRDLIDCWSVLEHADVQVSRDRIDKLAATLIQERVAMLADFRKDGQLGPMAKRYWDDGN